MSDSVGEKLHEDQVSGVLGARGFLVADPERPGYDLWGGNPTEATGVIGLLRQNPYFAQALDLGQLAPVRVQRLPDGWPLKVAASLAAARGGRLGDVKLPTLISSSSPEEVATWLA